MLIGHLRTGVIEKQEPNSPLEGGFFEIEIRVPKPDIEASGAPWSFVAKEIGVHLAQAMQDTTVPRNFWMFYPTTEAQKMFNLPTDAIAMGK